MNRSILKFASAEGLSIDLTTASRSSSVSPPHDSLLNTTFMQHDRMVRVIVRPCIRFRLVVPSKAISMGLVPSFFGK